MKNYKKREGKGKDRRSFFSVLFFIGFIGLGPSVFGMEADEIDERAGRPPKFSSIPLKLIVSDMPRKESTQELMGRVNRWLAGQARNFFPQRPVHTGHSKR